MGGIEIKSMFIVFRGLSSIIKKPEDSNKKQANDLGMGRLRNMLFFVIGCDKSFKRGTKNSVSGPDLSLGLLLARNSLKLMAT
jgi:hypothetical protein